MVSLTSTGQTVLVLGVFGAGLAALLMAVLARSIGETPAARRYVRVLVADAAWCFSYGFMLASPSSDWALMFHGVGASFALASVVLWFEFAVEYTGNGEWLTRRNLALLWVGPVVYSAFLVTNPLHEWLKEATVAEFGGLLVVPTTTSPVTKATALATMLLVFVGLALLVRFMFVTRNIYRKQTAAIIGATLTTAVAYVLYQLGVSLHPAFNPTPLFFFLQVLLIGVALFRYDFLDVSPVATELYLERMADPLVVLDEDGMVIDANGAARRAVGLPADLDVHVSESLPGLADVVDGNPPDTVTFQVDGERSVFEPTVTAIRDQYDYRRGLLVVLRDVTDRVDRERQLQRQNEQLERFGRVVSHDLRNPLSVARSYAELAREADDTDHLAETIDALDEMEAMIDDLLALAREGRTVDDAEPVDLATQVRRAWDETDTRGATLHCDADVAVRADPRRLRELLGNLFRNSVEHGSADSRSRAREDGAGATPGEPPVADAPEDGAGATPGEPPVADAPEDGDTGPADVGPGSGDEPPPLQLTVGVVPPEEGFYVADDGTGIPAEEREQVFEFGFTTSDGGTGLGLSIVREIAQAHGWSVRVTDSESGGARFEVTGVEFVSTG